MTLRIFSKFPSVAPTHFERKFFNLIVVKPHSFAKVSATNVLPVPIGPVKRIPIGTRERLPLRMLSAITSRSFLTSSIPPTISKPRSGITNSTNPKHSRSRISRLRPAINLSASVRARSSGFVCVSTSLASGATSFLISSRFIPEVKAASL